MIVGAVDAQTLVDAVGLGAVYALMAVGIGLVFGVLRLVNFAYGQLIMVGAYTLAFTSGWPAAASIAACFVVVVALSLAMEGAVFRPLDAVAGRDAGDDLRDRLLPPGGRARARRARRHDRRAGRLPRLAQRGRHDRRRRRAQGDDRRSRRCSRDARAARLLLARTTIGLQMRAAATDFRTARLLGVRDA